MTYRREIEGRFGITEVEAKSPNIAEVFIWNPNGYGTGVLQFTWLVTDGKHEVSGYDGKDPRTIEMLKLATSSIKHVVTDASWTVACTYTKQGDDVTRTITLYTESTCYKNVYAKLERYLAETDYARFEDIIENFIVE